MSIQIAIGLGGAIGFGLSLALGAPLGAALICGALGSSIGAALYATPIHHGGVTVIRRAPSFSLFGPPWFGSWFRGPSYPHSAIHHAPPPVIHHAPPPVIHHAPPPVMHHASSSVMHHASSPVMHHASSPVMHHAPPPIIHHHQNTQRHKPSTTVPSSSGSRTAVKPILPRNTSVRHKFG